MTTSYDPIVWVPCLIAAAITFAISASLLQSDLRQRNSGTTHFTTTYLRVFSLINLCSGFLATLLSTIRYIPGLCLIDNGCYFIAVSFQVAAMGFYQLSRLYYCFNNQQIHRQDGYPTFVFIIMITMGTVLTMSVFTLFTVGWSFPSSCSYSPNGVLTYEYNGGSLLFEGRWAHDDHLQPVRYFWWYLTVIFALLWDLTTLLLYIFKIWYIGAVYSPKAIERGHHRDSNIWINILFILHRVVILTIFYQFYLFLTQVLDIVIYWAMISEYISKALYTVLHSVNAAMYSPILSLSMYLMMDHNTMSYIRFLHFFRRFYLKYICFLCCHGMVDRQLESYDSTADTVTMQKDIGSTISPTMSRLTGMRLSVPTSVPTMGTPMGTPTRSSRASSWSTRSKSQRDYRIPNPRPSVPTMTAIYSTDPEESIYCDAVHV